MAREEWKEKHLEELLRQMPKVSDNRNPDDLYQQLSEKLKKKKRVGWLVPGFASAVAFIILIMLIPSFNERDQSSNFDMMESPTSKNNVETEFRADKKAENEESSLKMAQDNIAKESSPSQKVDMKNNVQLGYPYLLENIENHEQPSLVIFKERVTSIEEALEIMRSDSPSNQLTAAIPKEFVIEKLIIKEKLVTIYLEDKVEIPQTNEMTLAVEAILLSAKSFGYSAVEFKHGLNDKIGPFIMNQSIKVPVSAN